MPDSTGKACDRASTFLCYTCLTHSFYQPRYGQEREVFCKVYYTPVSIEERLLLWRHRFESQDIQVSTEETTIFAPIRGFQCEDQEEDQPEGLWTQQTEFLLNLRHGDSNDG